MKATLQNGQTLTKACSDPSPRGALQHLFFHLQLLCWGSIPSRGHRGANAGVRRGCGHQGAGRELVGLKLGCEGKGRGAERGAGPRGSGDRRSPGGQWGGALLGDVIIIPHTEVTRLFGGWRDPVPGSEGSPQPVPPGPPYSLPPPPPSRHPERLPKTAPLHPGMEPAFGKGSP